ncbi:hypothetical protein WICMUC_003728 [Wickerhamomyces mucosus]|uniref:Uncharacterized protein n=1 Tax=Wickerhamomyces mucosus TaxID=1378264 RepID=A0A9P8PKW3_9ASCO|nr:hypothetical protein WICMUC_003728 [Wickerhamomyces mucosus]
MNLNNDSNDCFLDFDELLVTEEVVTANDTDCFDSFKVQLNNEKKDFKVLIQADLTNESFPYSISISKNLVESFLISGTICVIAL